MRPNACHYSLPKGWEVGAFYPPVQSTTPAPPQKTWRFPPRYEILTHLSNSEEEIHRQIVPREEKQK